MSAGERKAAERRVGLARLWARAKQIVTTDPRSSEEDDAVVDEEVAQQLAAQAGRLKGGLAKVAQLAAMTATGGSRRALGKLWDGADSVSASAITAVIEADLGRSPQQLFARWDATPLASASLGQVHAARTFAGEEVVVKVQYPGVAEALRADLADDSFVRKLAGGDLGRTLDDDALAALGAAVRSELDYRAEAEAQGRFAAAWAGDPVLRVPRVLAELSGPRVLTMERALGRSVLDIAGTGDRDARRATAAALFRFAWGSPLAHGLLNADPNPGNFLVQLAADGAPTVWCLDFGCTLELPAETRDADRDLWFGLLDDDPERGTERFRIGLAHAGLLRRADTLATTAHRDWERALAAPVATHGDFHWTAAYAHELAESTSRVLANGGMRLPARLLLLWRQRLGAAHVIALLDAQAPFRRALIDLVGTGRQALR